MKQKAVRRGKRSKKPLVIAGLVTFVAVDVALVALALGISSGDTTSDLGVAPTASVPTAQLPSEEPSPAPTSSAPTPTELTAPAVLLSAVDAETAYRVSSQPCTSSQTVSLERSIDAGVTWSSSLVTTDMRSPFSLEAVDASYAYMLGLGGQECLPGLTATYTSGVAFQTYPERVAATWYSDPSVADTVHSPTGDVAAPCVVHQLASIDDAKAAVLCNDRTAAQTFDGGQTWTSQSPVEGAQSIASAGEGYVIAATGTTDCIGAALSSLVSGQATTPTPLGCASDFTVDAVGGNDVIVAEAGGAVWLSAGDLTAVSVDGGSTW